MDNQPRLSPGAHHAWDHDHLSWIDTTTQAIFSARILVRMADILGRRHDVADLVEESDRLDKFVNRHMWDDRQGFYVDLRRDGTRSGVKSIAGYWALMAGIAPRARRARMIAHLTNPKTFGRPHPVPTLAADDPHYAGEKGEYWLGSVWPSTNYMVLRALTEAGQDQLAHELGLRHHEMVTRVYRDTGTYFENYSPEKAAPGQPAKSDFVGWGGVGPIAVFFEYVLGLRPDHVRKVLVWDVRRSEGHGVRNYPVGKDNLVDLAVAARVTAAAPPVVTITARHPLRVELRWEGGSRVLDVAGSRGN
jgi:glycogen debranching enzyme